MKRITIFLCVILVMAMSANVLANPRPDLFKSGPPELIGGNADAGKASRDTVILIGPWGSGAQANGQFQSVSGLADWNGWTHVDLTQSTESNWQISDYFADNLGDTPEAGNLAAWCGSLDYEPCSEEDPAGGYGNDWTEHLDFFAEVANPAIGVSVTLSAFANIDSEPGFDRTNIFYESADGFNLLSSYEGTTPNIPVGGSFTLGAGDYVGAQGNQVHLRIQFRSDAGYSDQDCAYPSAGGVQIDDITVTLNQGSGPVTYFTDFESGWGGWEPTVADGVGDFTQLWTDLEEVDPCATNYSPQVAFIDDGLIVPGVGPSLCNSWCYGPGGYIVNTTGGLAGPDYHLKSAVQSPVLAWPQGGYEGAYLRYDVYRHEDLSDNSPGMFYAYLIRSTNSEDPADIEQAPWVDRNGVFLGGPDYFREHFVLSDLMVPGAKYVQIQLICWEAGYMWNYVGNDGFPAPYFDNVRFIAYPRTGPALSANELYLAQDNFPTIGELLMSDPGANSVRFDMARNIAPSGNQMNDPGDTLVIDIAPGRDGAELVGSPQLHWTMLQNPLFNDYRTSEFGAATSGVTDGVPAVGASGTPTDGKWAFDLPDEHFFYPGDVIHYYISATDAVHGMNEQTSTLPANRDGYGDFSGPLSYNSSFVVRALPSVYEDPLNPGQLVTPGMLFWNDFANRGGEEEWYGALSNLGFVNGVDYDIYYTNRPDSGEGNGLGGRATSLCLMNYDNMLYSSGDLTVATISNGDYSLDPGNDVELLDSWLRQGNKGLLLTGDAVVSDLMQSGPETTQFVDNWLKVNHESTNLRPLLGNQSTPMVKPTPDNGVFTSDMSWVAFGGCPIINQFDALEANTSSGGIRLAEFTTVAGQTGQYSYSAATLYEDIDTGSRVVTMPYDFMEIHNAAPGAKVEAPLSARALVLEKILALFGVEGDLQDVSAVPQLDRFAVRNYPNPFNPTTKIEYTMPRAGHLSLKIFNMRGELVKTLIDEQVADSGSVIWDGSDDGGAKVSSGVYFYEARTAGQVQVEKMALVK